MSVKEIFRRNAAFTLTELMAAIGVASLIMAIAVPSFMTWLPSMRLTSAARQVATDLQVARMRAITQNTTYPVTFDVLAGTYSFGSESRDLDNLYPGVSISSVTPSNPTFFPRGTANGATTITLSNGSETRQVQVTPVGRVNIS